MDPISLVIIAILGFLVTYYIIYAAVLAALREHSVWKLAGGAKKRLDERIARRDDK